jgi:hypothetical protein
MPINRRDGQVNLVIPSSDNTDTAERHKGSPWSRRDFLRNREEATAQLREYAKTLADQND